MTAERNVAALRGRDQAAVWLRRAALGGVWAVVVFLGLWFMRRDALKYFDWSPDTFLRFWPNRILLAGHIVGAGVALPIGPLQFVTPLRRRFPMVHRSAGWTYALAVLLTMPLAIRHSPAVSRV